MHAMTDIYFIHKLFFIETVMRESDQSKYVLKISAIILIIVFFLNACDKQENKKPLVNTPYVTFTTGHEASVVIGQTDFVSKGVGLSDTQLNAPYTNSFVADDGTFYIPDWLNNRILMFDSIPVSNGATASMVIGQPDFTTSINTGASATQFYGPVSPVEYENKLYVLGWQHSRLAIFNTVPTISPGTIDVVLGQQDKVTSGPNCNATGLNKPESLWIVGGKLFIADGLNHRVLIWNTIPTLDNTPADYVLGQFDMESCEANGGSVVGPGTFNFPTAVWSDGDRIVVSDSSNNRVLIWNSFPSINGQDADIVLGQADFFSNAANRGTSAGSNTLHKPYEGLHVANNQLFVADELNNRVLIWNSFPTESGQAADVVIGQNDFTSTTTGITSTTLDRPNGVFLYNDQLIVTDGYNHRVLVYSGEWSDHF